jgi:hypothetical protein
MLKNKLTDGNNYGDSRMLNEWISIEHKDLICKKSWKVQDKGQFIQRWINVTET